MTRDEVAAVLYSINDLYPHVKTTPEAARHRVDLWYEALKEYDTKVVVEAVKLHTKDTKVGMFYPTPAHVIAKMQGAEYITRPTMPLIAPEMTRIEPQAVMTYKQLVAEFEEADRANMTCCRTIDETICTLSNFKAYREGGLCDLCPNAPKMIKGGETI